MLKLVRHFFDKIYLLAICMLSWQYRNAKRRHFVMKLKKYAANTCISAEFLDKYPISKKFDTKNFNNFFVYRQTFVSDCACAGSRHCRKSVYWFFIPESSTHDSLNCSLLRHTTFCCLDREKTWPWELLKRSPVWPGKNWRKYWLDQDLCRIAHFFSY